MSVHSRSYSETRRRRAAFTLLEIMIVLVILMTLSGAGVMFFRNAKKSADKNTAQIYVNAFETPLETFHLHIGRFPSTEEGLAALIEPPSTLADPDKWEGPYIKDRGLKPDPWGNPYQYVCPGTHSREGYDLWSLGPDMADGTEDDIGNWN